MNDDKDMIVLVDMGCRQTASFDHLREQVIGFLGLLPTGWRMRLVGYGVRSLNDGDYMSSQPYGSTVEEIVRQFREVGNVPFSAKAGNPDCAWRWLAKMDAEPSSGVQVIWFALHPERTGGDDTLCACFRGKGHRMMADRKMSLNELSEKVGIANVNLSKIKTGKVSAIRFSTLEAICEALNCQPGDILEYRREDNSNS